jgi:uncharacterized delta-60 repeat protein
MLQYKAAVRSPHTLIIIDAGIDNYLMLADGASNQAALVILDLHQDGIAQITDALCRYPDISSLHLFSHGSPGTLYLGNTELSGSMSRHAAQLRSWLQVGSTGRVKADFQIFLYGCNVAATPIGAQFLQRLHHLTGATIYASETPTGHVSEGGNWHLEVCIPTSHAACALPQIPLSPATLANYPSVLAPGDLDTTFGTGGTTTLDFNGGFDQAKSVVVQPDGKIVVAGVAFNGTNNDFALTRYNIDGTLDTSFGSSGKVITPVGSGADQGHSVVVQSDGKIVVAGVAFNGSNNDFALTRYNVNGTLDTSFGSSGKVITPVGSGADQGYSVVVQSDGKIVVAGVAFNGTNDDFALTRYNVNGTLDTSFGSSGKVITPVGSGADQGFSVVVQSDGKIVVAGVAFNGTNDDFALTRYNVNGTLDTSFGSSGKVITPVGSGADQGYSVVVQPDGKIVVAGVAFNGTNDFALTRYNIDGTLDTSFGSSGKVITPVGSGADQGYSVVVQPDGKIVVAGVAFNGTNDDFALTRYNIDGTLDTSFGSSGKVITPVGSGADQGYGVAVQPDGKIVLAGQSGNDFAVVRYAGDSPAAPTIASITADSGTAGDGITNDNTLVISGKGVATSTVQVFRNSTAIGTTLVDAAGNWSFDATGTTLLDGAYAFTATTMISGNTSPMSTIYNATIDTVMAAPVISAITADSGVAGDGITSDNTLILSGTAEANSTIQVFRDATLLGNVTANAAGNWTYDSTSIPLANGAYAFTVTATDAAGNSASSAAFNVTIDSLAPAAPAVVTITTDSGSADGITNDNALILTGTAEANSTVTISQNGTAIGTATANGTGNWTLDRSATTLLDGNYTYTATATDAAGNVSPASANFLVTVDTGLPAAPAVVTITTDSGSADGITNDNALILTGTAEANSTVTISQNGTVVGTALANGTGNWTLDRSATVLADGNYTYTATATDTAGNVSPASANFLVTVDTGLPAAPAVVTITTDSGSADGITNDNTLILTGTAEANSTVTISQNGTVVGTATANGTGNWTLDRSATVLADGNYTYTATATDTAGNVSPASANFLVTVDTGLPAAPAVVTITTDSGSADGITNDNALILTGTAEANSTVTISQNGTVVGTATANGTGNWTLDRSATTLLDGNYTYTATATDAAGNVSAPSANFLVTVDTGLPAAPAVVTITTDSGSADGITNDNALILTGTAEANSTVTISQNGTAIGTATANGTGNWTLDRSATTLLDGNYTYTATATDAAGNISAPSANFLVTVDTGLPAAPAVVTITTDSGSADGITNDNALILMGTAEANSTVTISQNGTVVGTATANGTGNWTLDRSATVLADGNYTYTATATDAAGNVSPASANFLVTVDTVAPIAPAITSFSNDSGIVGDSITNDNTLILSGTAEANSTVQVSQNGTGIGIAATNAVGIWSFNHTGTTLTDGSYTFTATATDVAGNIGNPSANFVVTVDTAVPTTPIVTGVTTDTGIAGDGITKDSTLIINGTAEANSKVQVLRNGVAIGTATTNASGNWAFDATATSLANGAYAFTAQATDAAGNVSAISAAFNVTIDTTVPAAPTIATITTDSGIAGDRVTNDNTLLMAGTAEANSSVELFQNGTAIGFTSTNGTGNWTFDYTGTTLTDGAYTFTARATDVAGNVSAASANFAVTVDTIAPSIPSITGFSTDTGSPDRLTSDNTLIVSGTAEANRTVEVFLDSVSLGTINANATGNWTFNYTATPIADGVHNFTATARDLANNVSGLSPALTVTIDTIAPAAPVITTITDDTGNPTDRITTDTILLISGTAEANSSVQVFLGGTAIGITSTNASGNWSLDTGIPLANGNYSFTARSTDAVGNVSATSATFNVTIDTIPPAAPAIAAITADTNLPGDRITSDTTLIFNGTAEANSTVQVFLNSTAVGTAVTNGTGAWTFDYTGTALADGTYAFTARAIDIAGNTSAASAAFNVTIDTTLPATPTVTSITTDTNLPTDGITSDKTLVIGGAAEATSLVTVLLNGAVIGTTTADAVGKWSFNYTGTTLADGSYALTATATDAAGNTGAASAPFNVIVDAIAPPAPAVTSITTDTNLPDGITSDKTLVIGGTAEANSTVRVFRNGAALGTTIANATGNWSFDYTGTVLVDSNYVFTASATDIAGNIGIVSAPFNVTVDTIAPAAPLIISFSADTGVAGDGVTGDNTLVLTGTAEANGTVQVSDGGTAIGTVTADAAGNWTFDYSGTLLTDGNHSFTATATDAAGNLSAASTPLAVVVDTIAPPAPVVSAITTDSATPADGMTNDNMLVISGTAEANSQVQVLLDGNAIGIATTNGTGNWTFDYTGTAIADGNHALTATATDAAGNLSAASTPLAVVVDTIAPPAPVVSAITTDSATPADGITNDNMLVISGTAEANSQVQVLLDGNAIGIATTNGTGNWTFDYTGTAIADGNHALTATATDAAGNLSAVSAALNITIDTALPAAPVVAAITDDSATPADGITNDNTLVISGTAEANSQVQVLLDGNAIGIATTNGTGNWTFDYTGTAIADGNHDLTATATDAAGNLSAVSAALNITIDTALPAAPVVAAITDDSATPADGITNDNTLVISGTAEANSQVQVLLDGNAIGTATTNGTGNWTFDYTGTAIADGNHALTATATDAAGNLSAVSAALNITIDTALPAAPVVAAITDDSGAPNDFITQDNTLILDGTAEANSAIQVFLDGGAIGTATADATGNWSFDYTSTPLADGSYAFTATATDATGNTSVASAALNATIDTLAPGEAIVSGISTDAGVADDGITNDNTLILNGTAEANSLIEVFRDSTSIGTTITDATGKWSFDYTGTLLTDGTYAFTTTTTDVAGNVSPISTVFDVTIDTVVPVAPTIIDITTDSDIPGDGITNDNTLILGGTAEANSQVEVFQDGVSMGTTIADGAGDWLFDHTSTPLADGTYSFTSKTMDAAGNISAASTAFLIKVDAAAPAAPVVTAITDDTGTPGDRITNDNRLIISGTAEANTTVRVYRNSFSLGTTTADVSGNWAFDYTTIPLADGSHDLTATATDTAGNISLDSAAFTITVDTTPPASPVIVSLSADSGISGDRITNDNTLILNGTAEADSTITIFQGSIAIGTAPTDASGSWAFDYTGTVLADGAYSFTATTADSVGNVSVFSTAFDVEIDTTPPSSPIISGFDTDSGIIGDGITRDNTLLFSGTAVANSTIAILQGGTAIGTTTADGAGDWLFDYASTPLADGIYGFTATTLDVAGNVASSPALTVEIDTTLPTIALSSPAPADVNAPFTVTATFSQGVTDFTAADLAIGNGSVSNFTPVSNTTYTFTVTPAGNGGITVDVGAGAAQDIAGNDNTAAAQLSRTFDSTPPTAPVTSLAISSDTGFSNSDGITKNNAPTVMGTGEAGSTIEIFTGTVSLGTTQVDSLGNWSFTPKTPLADGSYKLSVKATDKAGNVSPTSGDLNLQIDTKPATSLVLSVSPDARDSTIDPLVGTLTLRFSEAVANFDLSDLKFSRDGSSIPLTGATLTTLDNITWTLGNLQPLTVSDGKYSLLLTSSNIIDIAGNTLTSDTDTGWIKGKTGIALPVIQFKGGKLGLRHKGSKRSETIKGSYDNDVLRGGDGNDRIFSGYGAAKFGRDILDGGAGNDQLYSGAGRDILNGGSGDDALYAGKDNDQLSGGIGNDRLLGQGGDDVLVGGAGTDTLVGGAGKDTFVFNSVADGTDLITDFESSDRIDLRKIFAQPAFAGGTPFARFHQFTKLVQVGSSTEVQVDADGSGKGDQFATLVTLQNKSMDTISSTQFVII